MDDGTASYYDQRAKELADFYERGDGAAKYFRLAFAEGARVIDVGAGSGRDASRLADAGHEVYGVEPSSAMRDVAVTRHPRLGARLIAGALPDAMPDVGALGGPFDGLLCSAVLHHVPRSALFDAVFALRGLLKPGGRALVSIPVPPAETAGREARDEGGRFLSHVLPEELQLLFERVGFTTIGSWRDPDTLGRARLEWATFLFQTLSPAGTRPLDLVESVLSRRERKVATYKLALFRALCEIATTQSRSAHFRPDGRVGVPVDAIATRWILYYWPIFESRRAGTLLPQMSGERSDGKHNLAFAGPLDRLVAGYARQGGLTSYALDERAQRVPTELEPVRRALGAKVRDAIKSGPVTHAGGARPIFKYEAGQVLVTADLWRELCLMGHWIHDALLVRWADLTVRLSGGAVTRDRVLAALLTEPDPERETAVARNLYRGVPGLACVWTGVGLDARFDVDHVIPFALWRNNDLWNLLPTSARINNEKRDLLPARKLLLDRRGAILGCWDVSRKGQRARFEREAAAMTGLSVPSAEDLFSALVESVEVTAVQHGIEKDGRWAG